MKVTAKLDGQEKPHRTLADLDNGVAATTRMEGQSDILIRWRDGGRVCGPDLNCVIGTHQCCTPDKYEVLEVLGRLTIEFEDE